MSKEQASIERRGYQIKTVMAILKAKRENKNIIVELDAGMGKRVISMLLAKHIDKNERILIITPTQASVKDTKEAFNKFKKKLGIREDEIGILHGGIPQKVRIFLLKKRILICTPISLLHVLEKNPKAIEIFNFIIINEVDKTIRRAAELPMYEESRPDNVNYEDFNITAEMYGDTRAVYPWNMLRRYFPKKACIIGMSGTLRDSHVIKRRNQITYSKELITIAEAIFPKNKPLEIISMDFLLERTDAHRYIIRNLTRVKPVYVYDDLMKEILDTLTNEIEVAFKKLAKKHEEMLKEQEIDLIEAALPLIPSDDNLKRKILRLALVRKFLTASIPDHYSKFLRKPMIQSILRKRLNKELSEIIPKFSTKIEKILEIVNEWISLGKKIVILTSYIVTAKKIQERLKNNKLETVYLITGKTMGKNKIIHKFRENSCPAILIMTPVGERDIDLPEADLVLVHDVVNTVKTMYQRFKRGRRSFVLILVYKDTFEEIKVKKLLDRMQKLYPWSISIEI